jgi:hypothetical protein
MNHVDPAALQLIQFLQLREQGVDLEGPLREAREQDDAALAERLRTVVGRLVDQQEHVQRQIIGLVDEMAAVPDPNAPVEAEQTLAIRSIADARASQRVLQSELQRHRKERAVMQQEATKMQERLAELQGLLEVQAPSRGEEFLTAFASRAISLKAGRMPTKKDRI